MYYIHYNKTIIFSIYIYIFFLKIKKWINHNNFLFRIFLLFFFLNNNYNNNNYNNKVIKKIIPKLFILFL